MDKRKALQICRAFLICGLIDRNISSRPRQSGGARAPATYAYPANRYQGPRDFSEPKLIQGLNPCASRRTIRGIRRANCQSPRIVHAGNRSHILPHQVPRILRPQGRLGTQASARSCGLRAREKIARCSEDWIHHRCPWALLYARNHPARIASADRSILRSFDCIACASLLIFLARLRRCATVCCACDQRCADQKQSDAG